LGGGFFFFFFFLRKLNSYLLRIGSLLLTYMMKTSRKKTKTQTNKDRNVERVKERRTKECMHLHWGKK